MDEHLAHLIGGRVRAARAANRQTQAVVAGLSGITADYLYQIERGKKLPTIPVLVQLAKVLRVPLAGLLGERATSTSVDRLVHRQHAGRQASEALYRALTRPTTAYEPPPAAELRQHVNTAWHTWQSSPHRYSKLTTRLPMLITDVITAERCHHGEADRAELRDVQRCATDLYGLLRTVAKRMGRIDLALLVADRAIRAAEAADDPLRIGAARWNLAHVLLADGEPEGAEAVAMQAADGLRPLVDTCNLDATALYGALTLLSAIASVRQGEVWTARERVRRAAPLATRTGERNVFWTAFGPVNVAMHAVSIEVEAGETGEALRLAEQIDYDHAPSIERRVAFLLEQATGYERQRDYASTLLMLQTVARDAPEDVAYRSTARNLLDVVIQRGRRPVSGEAARLAVRVGMPVG